MFKLLLALLLTPNWLLAQNDPKGVTPLPAEASAKAGQTRAVVIGISDYQDEKIPDLRFADRDAEAFAAWLQSEAGENLPASQITVRTNEQAKLGNIVAALTWLLDECKPGERAILYFSGHGDVEKATMFQRGYLLAYDMPPTNYMAGGINVRDIQDVVSTLSNRGVQVLMITDACRAGKLAGSETGGAQATTAALQQQFANEIKVLSCQPDEFSIEGEQWGGGRGAFSYHLIDGLCGLADRNGDGQVSLFEIGNYLQEAVPRETAPQSQMPMTVGNPKARLASVNEQVLLAVKTKKAGQPPVFSLIEQKGMEEMVLAKADSSIRETYAAFLAAIERGDLLAPAGKSADDFYRKLIVEPGIAQLHGLMKRNFAAALQNESQVVTNKLLKTDPNVVSDVWSRPFVFDHIPAYLARAAEILGEGHFFYKYLKAKQCFFEAKTYRRDRYPDVPMDSLLKKVVSKLEEGIRYDTAAAYLQVDLGIVLFWRTLEMERAMRHAKKALELSPNWAYAHVLAGRCYAEGEWDLEQGVHHYLRALELDSNCLLARQELFWMNVYHNSPAKNAYIDRYILEVEKLLAVDTEAVPLYLRTWYGLALVYRNRAEEAISVLEKVEQATRGQDFTCYQFLSAAYRTLGGRSTDRVRVLRKLMEINPNNPTSYFELAMLYLRLGRPEKAVETLEVLEKSNVLPKVFASQPWRLQQCHALLGEAYQESGRQDAAKAHFQKVLELVPDPQNDFEVNMKGRALLGLGDRAAMQRTIDEGFAKFPGDVRMCYQAAYLYSLAKEEQKALEWLALALDKDEQKADWLEFYLETGFKDEYLTNHDLGNICQSLGFKALMKKHFPDKVKD